MLSSFADRPSEQDAALSRRLRRHDISRSPRRSLVMTPPSMAKPSKEALSLPTPPSVASVSTKATVSPAYSPNGERAPFCDVTNDQVGPRPPGGAKCEWGVEKEQGEGSARSLPSSQCREGILAVQRFTLVSRGAPRTARKLPKHVVLHPPPSLCLEAQLGQRITVCSCSSCPGAADAGNTSVDVTGRRPRLCRMNTDAHTEYQLLLAMHRRFQVECAERSEQGLFGGGFDGLVHDACCRETSAFFIIGPEATVVGYVAAVLEANRRVRGGCGRSSSTQSTEAGAPVLLQIWVETEFRRRGFAAGALQLLLQDQNVVTVDGPTWSVLHLLENLGFSPISAKDGTEGRTFVTLAREFPSQ